jgi:hypothetical protein
MTTLNMVLSSFARSAILVCFCCLAFFVQSGAAASGSSIFSFLKINTSARNSGMGEIDSTISFPSAYQNPALLPWVRHRELVLEHQLYLADIGYSVVNYCHPVNRRLAISGSVGYLGMAGLPRTIADSSLEGYAEQGSFGANDMQATVGMGYRYHRDYSWGASVRVVQESIDDERYAGIMLSAGGFYRDSIEERWQGGIGVFNIGPASAGYSLPSGAYLSLGKDLQKNLFLGIDTVYYLDGETDLRTGFEYILDPRLALRLGYRYPLDDPQYGNFPFANLTAGLGFTFDRFSLDYAWLPYGDLGSIHRAAFTYRLPK